MASSLPDFTPFDITTDLTSVGVTWKKWIQIFDNFSVPFNITMIKEGRKLYCYTMVVKNCYLFMNSDNSDYIFFI